jgi:hypothetical protein
MSVYTRVFPRRRPDCKRLAANAGKPHCPSPTCPWLVCACGAQINQRGDWTNGERGSKP